MTISSISISSAAEEIRFFDRAGNLIPTPTEAEAKARRIEAKIRQKAEQQCRELGICDHTRFLGKLEEVEDVLSIADLFLIPSGSETFGLAALEAMSCSVPVISSNIGGLPEVNVDGETGYLCDLDDTDCMAKYAVDILTDEKLHARLSENARKRAVLFNQDAIVTMYEDFYKKVSENTLQVTT